MSVTASLIAELKMEAETTRRLLECVPDGKMDWQPHAKAMPLGQLVQHVAEIPGQIASITVADSFDASNFGKPDTPASAAAVVATHDASVASAVEILAGMDDAKAQANWSLMLGDRAIMTMPRMMLYRAIMLNHWYHHRGQLSTYLRILDVKIPSIYGPSADVNPFM